MTNIDMECVELCQTLNRLPGIVTISSCCGHNERPYRIFFKSKDLESLPPLLFYFDVCHSGHGGWLVIAKTDCSMCPEYFYIEGPVGEEAYEASKHIASLINEYVENLHEGVLA
jgi:hypothetical protein